MKTRLVGIYSLDGLSCRLCLKEGTSGATFDTAPKKGETMRMDVSADFTRFNYTVGLLMHEVVEALMMIKRHRYEHDDHRNWSNDRFVFYFTHAQFAEFIQEAGEFLDDCYADFKKAWHEWKRKPKPIKKRKRSKK